MNRMLIKETLLIDRDTLIHCPTERLVKEVKKVFNKYGYKWAVGTEYDLEEPPFYGSNQVYWPSRGSQFNIDDVFPLNTKLIPAYEFLRRHGVTFKLYSRGIPERGAEVIHELLHYSWDNSIKKGELEDMLYYIAPDGKLTCESAASQLGKMILYAYEEIALPINKDIIKIDGVRYYKCDVRTAIANLKPVL